MHFECIDTRADSQSQATVLPMLVVTFSIESNLGNYHVFMSCFMFLMTTESTLITIVIIINHYLRSLFLAGICLAKEAKLVASYYATTIGWIIGALCFYSKRATNFIPIFGSFGGNLGLFKFLK